MIIGITVETASVIVLLAYLLVAILMLVKRVRASWGTVPPHTDEDGNQILTRARLGFVVDLLAVLLDIAVMINLAWPRPQVYGTSLVSQYFALLFLAVTVVGGFLFFSAKKRAYGKAFGRQVSRSASVMGATEAAIG